MGHAQPPTKPELPSFGERKYIDSVRAGTLPIRIMTHSAVGLLIIRMIAYHPGIRPLVVIKKRIEGRTFRPIRSDMDQTVRQRALNAIEIPEYHCICTRQMPPL